MPRPKGRHPGCCSSSRIQSFLNPCAIGISISDLRIQVHKKNIYGSGTTNIVLFACRKRYLDLLTSPTSRRTIQARSAVIRTLRAHLEAQGFLEVETPILSGQVGIVMNSDLDPDPDPPDPHVFGPPGSKSFYHQAKIVRKTLIPTVL
jgi:hypothetical protein